MISRLLNNSFKAAAFPKAWKVAEVISVPKEGNSEEPANNRLISLLPILSKVSANTLPAKHNEKCKESLCDSVVSNFDYVLTVISATVGLFYIFCFIIYCYIAEIFPKAHLTSEMFKSPVNCL